MEKPIIEEVENPEQMPVRFCCGCICVSKCFWNSVAETERPSEDIIGKEGEQLIPPFLAALYKLEIELKEKKK